MQARAEPAGEAQRPATGLRDDDRSAAAARSASASSTPSIAVTATPMSPPSSAALAQACRATISPLRAAAFRGHSRCACWNDEMTSEIARYSSRPVRIVDASGRRRTPALEPVFGARGERAALAILEVVAKSRLERLDVLIARCRRRAPAPGGRSPGAPRERSSRTANGDAARTSVSTSISVPRDEGACR